MRTSRYDTRRVEQEEEVVASRSGHQRLRFTLGPLPQRHAESHAPPSKQMVKKAARVVLQTRHRDGGCTAPRQATAPYTRRHNPLTTQTHKGTTQVTHSLSKQRRGREGTSKNQRLKQEVNCSRGLGALGFHRCGTAASVEPFHHHQGAEKHLRHRAFVVATSTR